jgi:3-oxosteroid 1-dehydrogenase
MGQALITRLRLSLNEAGVPLWLNTPVKELLTEDGHVVGVTAVQEGKRLRIRSKKGMVLSAGCFPRNADMRQKYQSHPITVDWTSASPGNTGDAIQMGLGLGAEVDLMDDAWWGPASLPPGEPPFFHVGERAYPGGIIVASNGKRFMNESLPYVDAIHEVYRHNSDAVSTIPSFFIMDQQFRDKYMFGTLFPRMKVPQDYYDTGYFKKAHTLRELAKVCGIDPQDLEKEVQRFNEFARLGTDTDFGRGQSAYDRYYGDPTVEPNNARVIGKDGVCIEGLYAVGNCSASVMGNTYPGPGGTIGPSMTFGYIAALHAATSK